MAAPTTPSVVDGLPFKDDKKKYILEMLDPVLEEMVGDVLGQTPDEPLDYMITWLRKKSGLNTPIVLSVTARNKQLKQELTQATHSLAEVDAADSANSAQAAKAEESEEEDDEEPPEGFFDEKPKSTQARQSVSAEAYGNFNVKKAFTPPSYPKTDEQKTRLNGILMKSFMFCELEKNNLDTIIMAMNEVTIEAGTKVINQGDNGDFLFLIEKGSLECKILIDGEDKVVKTCNAGDLFGELALLYNCPRAASVIAKAACICWKLDRETVSNIVTDAAVKRRNKYETFLQSVSLIAGIGAWERSQIADALKSETFKKDDIIVKQDDPGNKFYIVEEGSLYATKHGENDTKDVRVMDYMSGDYFGELALLKNQPRAASIVVGSEQAKVLSMTRDAFSKMLGPLTQVLAAQVSSYV